MVTTNAATREGTKVSDDFSAYVAARGPSLLRLAYVPNGNAADAEDVVQDALARALPRWSRISAADDIDAYVRRMVVNAQVSWWRRFRRRESPVATIRDDRGDIADDAADTVLAGVSDERVWQVCARLPTDQRVAIVLRFYEQLSYAEIAALTDCAEPTAVAGPRRAGWLSRPQRAWLPFR